MKKRCVVAALGLCLFSGCTEPGETTGMAAATGGVIGAGLGAIVGSQTGDTGTGLVIGAVAGSSAGALVGNAIEVQEKTLRTQDEAIERQDRMIASQRAEIEELRRLDRDGMARGRDDVTRGRFAGTGPSSPTQRTVVPHAVVPRAEGIRESTMTPASRAVPVERTIELPKSSPVKSEPAKSVAPKVTTAKVAPKSVPVKAPEISAALVEETVTVEERVVAIEPKLETPVEAGLAADVTGALQGAQPTGSTGSECANAADEISKAGIATDSADKLFHLRRALRLCPDNADYHNRLGEVYLSLSRTSDAEYEFREALRLDPHLEGAVKNLTVLGK